MRLADYAKDMQTQKSISGYRVLLEGAPVMFKSSMLKSVTLSAVCEGEQTTGVFKKKIRGTFLYFSKLG